MATNSDSGRIEGWSYRDILIRLDAKLDVIGVKLEEKADRSRVHAMAAEINAVDKRLTVIESQKLDHRLRDVESADDERRGEKDFRRYLWPALAAMVAASSWIPHLLQH